MPWDNCNLFLNSRGSLSFYSGDIVTGTVTLEFKHKQKIDQVYFKVIGISKASWTRPMPTMPYIKIYSQKSKVFDIEIDIFREINGKSVDSGLYIFHFDFLLPEDLPTTFKSSIAKVHYFIKIEGKAVNRFIKKTKILPFNVEGNINLNHKPDFLVPTCIEVHKTFWNSHDFSLNIKTYTAFASKQNIPIIIEIDNESEAIISKIYVILLQKLEYNVSSGYATDEKNICKVGNNKISISVKESCKLYMEIPQIPPSSINVTNPMVNISYIFRVQVIFPFHSTLYHDVPVTVATVPVIHYDIDK